MFDLLIRNTSEVLTAEGGPELCAERALAAVERGAVGIRAGQVAFLGPEGALPPDAVGPGTEILDAQGGFVGPGFVDPHTHLVFAGDRSAEFDLRCQGKSYLEIAEAGGGIVSTVQATRAATEDALIALALPRLARLLAQGVTTAEVKSGYGLSLDSELKMLRVVRRLNALQPITLIPTLLCAHALPPEHRSTAAYLERCVEEILPAVAAEKLARFCDVFCEKGAFTPAESRRMLEAGARHGLIPRLHADQLTAGQGAELAASLRASSADHLEHITPQGIAALAQAGVSALLIPITTFILRQRPYAPGRALRDAGVNVALGTNVNPGTGMSENLGLTLSLACLESGLTAAEAYYGMTRGAALALREPELGQLRVGGPADAVVFSCANLRHLPYHLAVPHARFVLKSGKVVHRAALASCVEPA